MSMRRRTMMHGLGAGVLGAVALSACSSLGARDRRGPQGEGTPSGNDLTEPDAPMILGSIGADHGRSQPFETAIAIAVSEAMIDLNASFEGLFGHEVEMLERIVVPEAGTDLAGDVEDLAAAGVSAVISSLDEEALAAAMPLFAQKGIAVIDVFTSGMSVRADEVETNNLLTRLSPNDIALAGLYAQTALTGSTEDGVEAGSMVYVSEETAQGRSLLAEIKRVLEPAGGTVLHEQFHPVGEMGEIAPLVETILAAPPALLVLNGGQEAGAFLSALYKASLGDDGRPRVKIPARLGPTASIDYAKADLLPECLESATGYEPGGDLVDAHVNMMLNVDPGLLSSGYAYSQQAYDAVMLAALAAQDALSLKGSALAGSFARVLDGNQACTDYGQCRDILHNAVLAGTKESIAFEGRMGSLTLGPAQDPAAAEIREVTWSGSNRKKVANSTTVEVEH